jgi:hypothetical protein
VAKLGDERWIDKTIDATRTAFAEAIERAGKCAVELHLPDHLGAHEIEGTSVMQTPQRRCDRPWREVVVRWDGALQVCNMFNPYTYGHLDVTPFDRAWNGIFARAFRELAHGVHAHPYCHGCYYLEGVYERSR